MSPTDITAIQKAASGRSIARDHGDAAPQNSARSATSASAGSAVKVETSITANAGTPPVDQSRVDAIRSALARGAYPLNPAQIADAMIAAPMLLSAGR